MTKADEIIKKHFTADEAKNILQPSTKTEKTANPNADEIHETRETQRFYMKIAPLIFLFAFLTFLITNRHAMSFECWCIQTMFSALTFACVITTLYIAICYFVIHLLLSFLVLLTMWYVARLLFPTTF